MNLKFRLEHLFQVVSYTKTQMYMKRPTFLAYICCGIILVIHQQHKNPFLHNECEKKLESNELDDEMKRDSYYLLLSLTIFPSARACVCFCVVYTMVSEYYSELCANIKTFFPHIFLRCCPWLVYR